jgi:hypothetical protein
MRIFPHGNSGHPQTRRISSKISAKDSMEFEPLKTLIELLDQGAAYAKRTV